MDLSIVIPVYNEVKSLPILYHEITSAVGQLTKQYEILFVDDGSTDGSVQQLGLLRKQDPKVKIIKFRRNFGQTAALAAGFKHAQGQCIVSLDADLQDNPAEIPRLLHKLSQGYDVVCAWRKKRRDNVFKRILSRFANRMRRYLTGDRVHDSGCTFRAYRREAVQGLELYGELHRAIPSLLRWKGFKISEVKVKHRRRKYGTTKYSMKRVVKGFLDLLVVKFWMDFSARPIHLFGSVGIISAFIGSLIGIYVTISKYAFGVPADRPLLLLSILLILLGFQSLMFGTLADIGMKIYYKDKDAYAIEKIHN